MINHNDFIIEHEKPNKDHYFLFKITDPERNKSYNTISKLVKANKDGLFVSGVYFIYDIVDLLKKNYFDKIQYTTINDRAILIYTKNGVEKKVILSEPFKANHFTNVMRDAGYEITLEFKYKSYSRKLNLYNYNIFLIKESLQKQLFTEFNITNKIDALQIFEKCWKDNNLNTINTQMAFMKQIILFKKLGEKI